MKIDIPPKYKKISVEVSRVFLGLVFVFSGFVKAVDPWGTAYKNLDYFTAFNLNVFDFLALPFSFLLSAIEFGIGIGLLMGIYRKFNSILVLLFMLFMTPLTLYLAIADPVSDCGCFGDAIVISNWETFFKNIFLLAAAIVIFRWYRFMMPLFTKKSQSLVFLWTYLFIFGVSFYCYAHLPILDFRPYKIGADIPELMTVPEDAEPSVFETVLIYSKDGKEQEFTLENYPKDDAGWTFVDSRSKLIKKGYEPPIHDFTITTDEGDDITDEVLENPSYTFLLIAHKFEKADDANVDKINEIYDFSRTFGYDFYALTSSLEEEVQEWKENTGAEYPVCTMDDITLKTIVRSNPGLLLIKSGVIINKWSDGDLPGGSDLDMPLEESALGRIPANYSVRNIMVLGLVLFTPLLILFLVDFFYYRKKEESKNKTEENIID